MMIRQGLGKYQISPSYFYPISDSAVEQLILPSQYGDNWNLPMHVHVLDSDQQMHMKLAGIVFTRLYNCLFSIADKKG